MIDRSWAGACAGIRSPRALARMFARHRAGKAEDQALRLVEAEAQHRASAQRAGTVWLGDLSTARVAGGLSLERAAPGRWVSRSKLANQIDEPLRGSFARHPARRASKRELVLRESTQLTQQPLQPFGKNQHLCRHVRAGRQPQPAEPVDRTFPSFLLRQLLVQSTCLSEHPARDPEPPPLPWRQRRGGCPARYRRRRKKLRLQHHYLPAVFEFHAVSLAGATSYAKQLHPQHLSGMTIDA